MKDLVDTVLSQVEKRVSELWSQARQSAEKKCEGVHRAWVAPQAIHHTLYDADLGDHQARAAACAIIDPLIEQQPPPPLLVIDHRAGVILDIPFEFLKPCH